MQYALSNLHNTFILYNYNLHFFMKIYNIYGQFFQSIS